MGKGRCLLINEEKLRSQFYVDVVNSVLVLFQLAKDVFNDFFEWLETVCKCEDLIQIKGNLDFLRRSIPFAYRPA